jgi:hypothetical protein
VERLVIFDQPFFISFWLILAQLQATSKFHILENDFILWKNGTVKPITNKA